MGLRKADADAVDAAAAATGAVAAAAAAGTGTAGLDAVSDAGGAATLAGTPTTLDDATGPFIITVDADCVKYSVAPYEEDAGPTAPAAGTGAAPWTLATPLPPLPLAAGSVRNTISCASYRPAIVSEITCVSSQVS